VAIGTRYFGDETHCEPRCDEGYPQYSAPNRRETAEGEIVDLVTSGYSRAFIEAVGPAISGDPDLYAYYQRLRIRKGANAARVATARRLLTIVYRVLSQEWLYESLCRLSIIYSLQFPIRNTKIFY